MKFPFSSCVVLTFIGIDPRVVSRGEVWENREAFERLEMARFDEDYMTELRLMHSELVAEERQLLEMYQKGLPTRLGRQVVRSLTFASVTTMMMTWTGRRS